MTTSLGDWLRGYLFPPATVLATKVAPEDSNYVVSGDEVIDQIVELIRQRRPVLVSGPRGCGKTYCCEEAIRRARDKGYVGGWRMLQGNREIPRDYLSEDMLVINNKTDKPALLEALLIRPLPLEATQRFREMRQTYADWPGIPAMSVGAKGDPQRDPRVKWTNRDWRVLFLDEVNRFADGFLDSLLSIAEEKKIVRRGEEYYVPVCVVATANPPGYDLTAKRLSPPLQARIAVSYRMVHPPLHDLGGRFLGLRLESDLADYPNVSASDEVRMLAAAATLFMWGCPSEDSPARNYLTPDTYRFLMEAARLDVELGNAMLDLAELISFGPDARSIGDWFNAAIGVRARNGDGPVTAADLMATAVPALGHKVRDLFNEGAEPVKVLLRNECIDVIARRTFLSNRVTRFVLRQARDEKALNMAGLKREDLRKAVARLKNPARRAVWLDGLASVIGTEGAILAVHSRADAIAGNLLTRDGLLYWGEKEWLLSVLAQLKVDESTSQFAEELGQDPHEALRSQLNELHPPEAVTRAIVGVHERLMRNGDWFRTAEEQESWLRAIAEVIRGDAAAAQQYLSDKKQRLALLPAAESAVRAVFGAMGGAASFEGDAKEVFLVRAAHGDNLQ